MAMSAALDVARRADRGRVRSGRPGWGWLRRLLGADEGIQIIERRHGTFPRVFVWRGRRCGVTAIERCWTISRPGLRGRARRLAFRVRFRSRSDDPGVEGTAIIYQDLKHNTWSVRPLAR